MSIPQSLLLLWVCKRCSQSLFLFILDLNRRTIITTKEVEVQKYFLGKLNTEKNSLAALNILFLFIRSLV